MVTRPASVAGMSISAPSATTLVEGFRNVGHLDVEGDEVVIGVAGPDPAVDPWGSGAKT
jgi:hypothetical protein